MALFVAEIVLLVVGIFLTYKVYGRRKSGKSGVKVKA
jgi:hypothetical protein